MTPSWSEKSKIMFLAAIGTLVVSGCAAAGNSSSSGAPTQQEQPVESSHSDEADIASAEGSNGLLSDRELTLSVKEQLFLDSVSVHGSTVKEEPGTETLLETGQGICLAFQRGADRVEIIKHTEDIARAFSSRSNLTIPVDNPADALISAAQNTLC